MSSWTQLQGIQLPQSSAKRAPSVPDESMFDLSHSTGTQFSPGSLISDRGETQFNLGSLMSIDENSHTTSYPPLYNQLQQRTRVEIQQAPFQFTSYTHSNTMPANNNTSLLSLHFKDQAPAYGQSYGTAVATSPVINQPSFPQSAGQAVLSPMHHFMSSSLNTNQHDQYSQLKFDEDWELGELQLLSPASEITSPPSDWPVDQGPVHTAGPPIGIPSTNKSHGRGGSFSNSVRSHPYHSPSYGGTGKAIHSPGTSFVGYVAKHFAPNQQQVALSIFNYKQAHPDSAIPASFITAELAEVHEGRGWCLLGNCGVDRAKQRLNPHYDIQKDSSRKRLDHLYDHIRDKHFNCRPFRCPIPSCAQTFSREHDLKHHEKTHTLVSLPCDVCGKHYTRDDNLKRHVQLKHLSLPQTSRGPSGTSYPF